MDIRRYVSLTIIFFLGLIPFSFAQTTHETWISDPKTGCRFHNLNPLPNESITFEGRCTGQTANGKLTWWLNGEINEIAEGQWINGKQAGPGSYRFVKSGNSFEGQFIDGRRSGKGVFKWANGNTYEGMFLDGQRTGRGVFKWPSGSIYEGDFIDGKRTGKGSIKFPDGRSYTGDFVDGKYSGTGVYKWPDGRTYAGGFLDSKFSGKGVETFRDGGKFVGDYLNGKPHGQIVITFGNSTKEVERWTAEFFDGEMSGRSVIRYANGNQLEITFDKGAPVGYGRVIFPGGQSIAGRFLNGEFVPDNSNLDHETCSNFGYRVDSQDYVTCRRQVEVAKRQIEEDRRARLQELAELRKRLDEDRRDAAIFRGISALALGATMFGAPPSTSASDPPMRVYNLPGNRTMTCSTFGVFTNCN
jgi:hypothetical protein